MSLIDLDALARAPLHTDPFDYAVAPGFLDGAALERINADYPAISSAANHSLEGLDYGDAFGELMGELQSQPLAEALGAKFGMDLAPLPTVITVRKFCERTDGNIHRDHRSKVVTVLVYCSPEWHHEEGKLRLLRSADNIEDYATEVIPAGGTLLAFKRTDHSWHGHTRFVGERRTVQLNYLDQGLLPAAARRVSRLGTQFMKNVLGWR